MTVILKAYVSTIDVRFRFFEFETYCNLKFEGKKENMYMLSLLNKRKGDYKNFK